MNSKDELRSRANDVVYHLRDDIACGYEEVDWIKEGWQGGLHYVNNILIPVLRKKFKPNEWKISVVGHEYSDPRDESWKIILEEV